MWRHICQLSTSHMFGSLKSCKQVFLCSTNGRQQFVIVAICKNTAGNPADDVVGVFPLFADFWSVLCPWITNQICQSRSRFIYCASTICFSIVMSSGSLLLRNTFFYLFLYRVAVYTKLTNRALSGARTLVFIFQHNTVRRRLAPVTKMKKVYKFMCSAKYSILSRYRLMFSEGLNYVVIGQEFRHDNFTTARVNRSPV